MKDKSQALCEAAQRGRVNLVEKFLSEQDPSQDWTDVNSKALIAAAEVGRTEVIKQLIPFSNPRAESSKALRWAVACNSIESVKLLLPVSDLKANNSWALFCAVRLDYVEMVQLLISWCNPGSDGHRVLALAIRENHSKMIKVLAPVGDIEKALNQVLEEKQTLSSFSSCEAIDATIPYLSSKTVKKIAGMALDVPGLQERMPILSAFLLRSAMDKKVQKKRSDVHPRVRM